MGIGGGKRKRRLWFVAVVAPLLALGVALLVAGLEVSQSARSGRALLEAGAGSLRQGDPLAASRHFRAAERAFEAAEGRVRGWPLRGVTFVPLLDRQAGAVHALVRSGSRLARVGSRLSRDADAQTLRLTDASIDLEATRRLQAPLQAVLDELGQAHADLDEARQRFLLPMLHHELARADSRVQDAVEQAETAALATQVLPALFGSPTPRRYFLAVQTPAELRGSGGMIGNFGELIAEGGRLRLERLGRTHELNLGGQRPRHISGPDDYLARYGRFRPGETWQNVTMSPDFPSVAEVIEDLYPQSGGRQVDGVLSVDPVALGALLELTGPVAVSEWPEPLTSVNTADILLRQQYLAYDRSKREDFLASTTRAVFDRLATTSLPSAAVSVRALAPAARGRHLMLHTNREDEQRLFERIGVSGAVPPVRGDFFSAVVQNASASKIDVFLKRVLTYRANFDPATGAVRAEATVRLENSAPTSGLPPNVLGGQRGDAHPGENHLYLSIYSPFAFTAAEVDGRPLLMESQRELGRNVYSSFVVVPPSGSTTVRVQLSGSVPAGPSYRLEVAHQPTVEPSLLDVEIRARRQRVQRAEGLEPQGPVARTRTSVAEDRSFGVLVRD